MAEPTKTNLITNADPLSVRADLDILSGLIRECGLKPENQQRLEQTLSHIDQLYQSTVSAIATLTEQLQERVQTRATELHATSEALTQESAQLRKLDQAVRTSEARSHLTAYSPLGIAVSDSKGILSDANDAFSKLTGWSDEEIRAGKVSWSQLTPPEYSVVEEQQLEAVRRSGPVSIPLPPKEIEILCKDGARIPVADTIAYLDAAQTFVVHFLFDLRVQRSLERESADALSQLRAVMDASGEAVLVLSPEGDVERINEEMLKSWRLASAAQSYAKRDDIFAAIYPQLQNPASFQASVSSTDSGISDTLDWLETKDGRMIRAFSQPLRRGSRAIGRVWVFRDVTNEVAAEKKLGQASLELNAIFTGFPDLGFLLDKEGRIVDYQAGPAAREKLFRAPSEFLGKGMEDVLPPEAGQSFRQAIEAVRSTQQVQGLEYRLPLQGMTHYFDARIVPLSTGQHYVIVRDNTANRLAELERELLIVQEQKARAAAESAGRRSTFLAEASTLLASSLDAKVTLSSATRLAVPSLGDWCMIDVMNPDGSFQRLASHVDGTKAKEIEALDEYSPNMASSAGIAGVIRTGHAQIVHDITRELLYDENNVFISNRAPGLLKLIDSLGIRAMMCVPLKIQGHTVGAVTFISATDPKRYGPQELEMGEELAWRVALAIDHARLYEKAQSAIRAREDLLAIVSHDLRNPLSAIYMNARLISHNLESGEMKPEIMAKQAEIIQQSTQRMHHLIRDLLDQAKIETGHFTVERKEADLGQIVGEVVDMMQPLAAQKSIQLLRPEIGDRFTVLCDRERVLQVLSNIIGNAIKFTASAGAVVLQVDMPDSHQIRIAVKDTGPGIAEEHLPHIFDRYWQPRASAKQGAGLGLAIAKGIVEAHGGRIWVESKIGVGTTFYFTLTGHEKCAKSQSSVS